MELRDDVNAATGPADAAIARESAHATHAHVSRVSGHRLLFVCPRWDQLFLQRGRESNNMSEAAMNTFTIHHSGLNALKLTRWIWAPEDR